MAPKKALGVMLAIFFVFHIRFCGSRLILFPNVGILYLDIHTESGHATFTRPSQNLSLGSPYQVFPAKPSHTTRPRENSQHPQWTLRPVYFKSMVMVELRIVDCLAEYHEYAVFIGKHTF